MENWRKYITEEEVEEGIGAAALGAALALGGGGKANAQQYDTDTTSGVQTTQQVDADKQAETGLQKNEDGSFSMDYSNPSAARGMSASMIKTFLGFQGKTDMMNKLIDAGLDADAFGYSITKVDQLNNSITLKATPK